jgi:hypothetical protein
VWANCRDFGFITGGAYSNNRIQNRLHKPTDITMDYTQYLTACNVSLLDYAEFKTHTVCFGRSFIINQMAYFPLCLWKPLTNCRTQPVVFILIQLRVSAINCHHQTINVVIQSKVKYNTSVSTLWDPTSLQQLLQYKNV